MTPPDLLAQLSGLHERTRDLLHALPVGEVNRRFTPELAALGWYLGRAVYRETYWLREVLLGDADLTARVRHLFTPGALDLDAQCAALPPPDHLANWAREIQDEHLRRLATPGALPEHPLLADHRLTWFLLQELARDYETMLAVLHARQIGRHDPGYRVAAALRPRRPGCEAATIVQGHFRVGSRHQPFAYDNELPPQAVELAGFRIARRPVSNAEYLAFIEAGGYQTPAHWDEGGRAWLAEQRPEAPLHWRRDAEGDWYAIGLNGPADLAPEEPVCGIAQHEAQAFARWAAGLDGATAGAVLQHEYQWEVAARAGLIEGTGRAWEWCANPFHPYPEFTPFPDSMASEADCDGRRFSLRGASLHTQRCLRRASFRGWGQAGERHRFAGLRLVLPPA